MSGQSYVFKSLLHNNFKFYIFLLMCHIIIAILQITTAILVCNAMFMLYCVDDLQEQVSSIDYIN